MAMPTAWKRLPLSPYRSYEVSDDGRIRRDGRELKGYVDRYGYRTVLLSYAGLSKRYSVSRLVCLTFHGPSTGSHEAAHLDGDKGNNAAANLAWATHRENNEHKRLHGTHQAGSRHPRAKLSDQDVAAIREAPGSCAEIGKRFGINKSHVSRIKSGARWNG
ncbi:HNH endonuclease [Sphingopyxis sp. C-1]|uniref:HNH endonuclease n=1 Tax=Sphingopyxis sp. C-1 TaxID=262667 RepID=UPI001EE6B120|nr:HNH endonuclease [Sphingopyxis sp. C-1]